VVPLASLSELVAHEHQLLAWLRPHIGVEEALVRELLPVVTGYLLEQRALAVHHLVVGQRQDEVLVEGVEAAKAELGVVVAAVERIDAEVREGVVHPAHVPLEPEPQPGDVGRTRHHGPGGRFLGDGLDVGVVAIDRQVQRARCARS
jgi:hypothetical protein